MISLTEKLLGKRPFFRVDFYNVKGKISFGELTFYPVSGMLRWTSDIVNQTIGGYLTL